MKTSPAMLGTGKLYWVLFLISHLDIWSVEGEQSCEQLYVRRQSMNVSAGDTLQLECPVGLCVNKSNVAWCKFKDQRCLYLGDRHRGHMNWEYMKNVSVFILHFDQVLASDNGSYRCSLNTSSGLRESHLITVYVTERTQNYSERPLITLINISDTTSAPGPAPIEDMGDRRWILYSLPPLVGLPLLITCCCLFCYLRRYQGEQKKPSDTEEREINLVDVPQPFQSQQIEVGTRQNSQTLSLESKIYDNDPWFGVQEECGVYSSPCHEENKQGIVYASLNHSVIGMNPRQARNEEEAPTEYAAICVRS
ncbi:PREDICTED: B- and T-lymphocyte attenuator isoform X1 [Hipposideros armiger]|uniref:B- and T-lymphocyte attenuator isoform X1 n=1 Tax=Hipposideros armiger TaxID=186990 RepID=A0A8B7S425_HIPAR|nr:PREDICTED: B- and T-lymphocyte attenuator isoform X1 [Hipposideros armiger]XP_019507759.1 PREDICTED: B- and T-lymphocyte attenuator isoform X1 [Hipposideros armiger]